MIERVSWEDLPEELRHAVEARMGTVLVAEPVAEGLNCSAALALHTESGRLFLKGVRETDTEGVAALRYEEILGPSVQGIGPAVRMTARAGGWICLGFAYVPGRIADLGPGSDDLGAVAAALRRMEQLPPPSVPGLRPLTERFAGHFLPGEAAALAGARLLHTDTNPHNILIDSGTAYIVDWAMPAVGPAWVDVAYTAVRLMENDQPPAVARAWLDGFDSWRQADPEAVAAFVAVTCRHWTATVGERGAAYSNARFRALLDTAA